MLNTDRLKEQAALRLAVLHIAEGKRATMAQEYGQPSTGVGTEANTDVTTAFIIDVSAIDGADVMGA